MKTGKYITLGYYNNVKIGYGTVDYKELKTIFLNLNSWLSPENEINDYDRIISKTKRAIKLRIGEISNRYFRKESIVDLDVKTKGIKFRKKSFLDLEITLYAKDQFDIKTKEFKLFVNDFIKDIIDINLCDKKLFNFNKTKN